MIGSNQNRRLIDADGFKKRLDNMEYVYLQDCYEDLIDAIECEITYFNEKTKGKWIVYKWGNEDMYCSICDMDFKNNNINRNLFNFCPFCGARMEE